MTQMSPGWYPDPSNPSNRIYWDGTAWSGPVPFAATPTQDGTSSGSRQAAVAVGVGVLCVIGLFMSMQSVSLLTGSAPIWTGVAVVAGGVAVAFFLGGATWVRVVASLLLALALANAFYMEHQLSEKRNELTHMFNS